ncbi:YlmH/Sll1252 family protein [Clostridium sp. A1-XYC3]|uniref:YlmH/Sll1252 family protein n=1 Tax=Clostridium tanneri TaxID=3037988 RepID=A0ABU4JNC1_9CLOT|nr:YlmH/Sll1252 family protein [Clostridium sp. A1-XYC3]MDW8799617.1 YlmH/Sll1252 family protein [Clostridium sp. A1-XYC3]
MDKKTFLNSMGLVEASISSKLYEKIMLAEKINGTIYTGEFYTPNVWKTIEKVETGFSIGVYTYGIFEDAERKMIAFSNEEPWHYPVSLIKITCNSKFNKVEHKDYLGALMALGIRREKFGDLILKDDQCYVAANEEISDYIKINLTSVGRCACTVEVADTSITEVPAYDFQTMVVNVASLRIDGVVASLCNIARGKAEELIKQGKVLVDYSEVSRKDKLLKNDCIITIRGYGKFKVIEEAGWTGSGRIKILVKKFI